ncbi:MAG: hypothetical protein ACQES9_12495 [Myxococcota bacterium]
MDKVDKIFIVLVISAFAGCTGEDSREKKKKLQKQRNIIHKIKSKEQIMKTDKKDTSGNKKKTDMPEIGNNKKIKKSKKKDISYTLKNLKRVPAAVPPLPEKLLKNKPEKRPEIPKNDRKSKVIPKSNECKSGKCKKAKKLRISR